MTARALSDRALSRTSRCTIGFFLLLAFLTRAADVSLPQPGDYVIRNFRFQSGETLPEVRMHYVTFGTPQRDAKGVVRNAVIILHGTTGSSAQFLVTNFTDVLFGK